jgi:hypothetical protein
VRSHLKALGGNGPSGPSFLRDGAPPEDRQPHWAWLTARCLGALALVAVGAIHLQQYLKLYSSVPTIGTLFLLNFIGATILGIALLTPIERWGGRRGGALLALVTLGGMTLAVVTFVSLAISENRPLFGFREPGYDPAAITASRVAELVTAVLLGAYLVARFVARSTIRRW